MRRRPWRTAVLLAAVLAAALTACAPAPDVPAWIADRAAPLATADPAAPLDDLEPLRRSVGDAQVVGLGESVHGAAELTTLKHRALRLLVEQMGFRTVAWEEDWTTGLLDRRVHPHRRRGPGRADGPDESAVPDRARSPTYCAWLRAFNAGRADPVRFVGVEYYFTGPEAYDAVDAHVAAAAPDRLADAAPRPGSVAARRRPTMFEHIGWFTGVAGQGPVRGCRATGPGPRRRAAHPPGDRGHAVALHDARQIRSFYEHFAMSDAEALGYRDARAAENLRWSQELTGDRVAYWAAVAHTADAPGPAHRRARRNPEMAVPQRRLVPARLVRPAATCSSRSPSATARSASGRGRPPTSPPASDRFERSLGEAGIDASSSTCAAPPRRRCEHGWTPRSAPAAWPIAAPTPPSPAEPRPNGST